MGLSAPKPRSVLSLDVGRRRIGLAGCDPLGISVKPLPALRRSRFEQDLQQLQPLCLQRRVEALVVGLPLDQGDNRLNRPSTAVATAFVWPNGLDYRSPG